jgi:hypothetical protein
VSSSIPHGRGEGTVEYGSGPLLEICTRDRSQGNWDCFGVQSSPLVDTRGKALQSVSYRGGVLQTWPAGGRPNGLCR